MTNTHPFANAEVLYTYTASQAEADGLLIRADEALCSEAGYRAPVLLTKAAHAEVVTWTRADACQDETGRLWDVLSVIRAAAKSSLREGGERGTMVYRVPNTTKSGRPSKSETASPVRLRVLAEGYTAMGDPCITVALASEAR